MNSQKSTSTIQEKNEFLTEQLVTYIGNKRALLDFIGTGVEYVKNKLHKDKLVTFDVFSGSGIVGRYLKQHSSFVYANDMEYYASLISDCYLSNQSDVNYRKICALHSEIIKEAQIFVDEGKSCGGFVEKFYAPKDTLNIQEGERCFYTNRNARYIDYVRQLIDKKVPENMQKFFLAPLLSECSVHANTSGVFKGFYKDKKSGLGKFGGSAENALSRINGEINLPLPVFSNFNCHHKVFCCEANELVCSDQSPVADLAYIDPPYNQHPYGSNYFMLNLIAKNQWPEQENMSRVSGIPKGWNRSQYNKRKFIYDTLLTLVKNVKAKFLLISFNNEGFIPKEQMIELLEQVGSVHVLEKEYNTFRGSRNLKGRSIYVKEYLFVVEKTKI